MSGHPLLSEAVERSVRSWKFEPIPAGPVDFDLTYEFALREKPDEAITFDIPGHVRIVSSPSMIYPTTHKREARTGD